MKILYKRVQYPRMFLRSRAEGSSFSPFYQQYWFQLNLVDSLLASVSFLLSNQIVLG